MEEQTSTNEYLVKKEQKEKERALKQGRVKGRKALRRAIYIVILFLVVAGIYKLIAGQAGPVPGEYFEAQSRDHILPGSDHPAYNSNPPTGGWHYDTPAPAGIYDKELPDGELIHNLEHSHIWISYKPDLSVDQIELLVKIAKDYGSRIIMTPRAANDSPIAVAAWEHLFKLNSVDEVQIKTFIDAYRGIAGPEKIMQDVGQFSDYRAKN